MSSKKARQSAKLQSELEAWIGALSGDMLSGEAGASEVTRNLAGFIRLLAEIDQSTHEQEDDASSVATSRPKSDRHPWARKRRPV